MSAAFEDDVEPLDEPLSRGRIGGQNQSGNATASGSRIPTPEPDEDLDVTNGKQIMWLVKVPRFLIEGWTKVDEVDKRLGTVRVYDADHKGYQRMELHLPQEPEPAFPLPPSHPYLQTHYPRTYDMRLTSEQDGVRVRNLYAFKERLEGGDEDDDDDDLDSGAEDNKGKGRALSESLQGRPKGRRLVSMVGKIANEASVKPQVAPPIMRIGGGAAAGITPEYRAVLRKRRLEAQKPKRSVKTLDESDKAQTNMLTSGVSAYTSKNPKTSFIAGVGAPINTGRKQPGATTERFARLPRNELLDILFELYDQYPYWSMKGLRSRVQQPEVYLREVLQTIADLHKRGPYSGNWSLKPEYLEMRKQQERETKSNAAASAALAGSIGTTSNLSQSQTTEAPSSVGGPSQGNAVNAGNKVKEEKADDDDDEDDEEDLEMEDVE